jgi:hypothetical protein
VARHLRDAAHTERHRRAAARGGLAEGLAEGLLQGGPEEDVGRAVEHRHPAEVPHVAEGNHVPGLGDAQAEEQEHGLPGEGGDRLAQDAATLAGVGQAHGPGQDHERVLRDAQQAPGQPAIDLTEQAFVQAVVEDLTVAEAGQRPPRRAQGPFAVGRDGNASRPAEELAPQPPGGGDLGRLQHGVLVGRGTGLVAPGLVETAVTRIGATARHEVAVVHEGDDL